MIKANNINDQGNHINTDESNQAFRLSAESRNVLEQMEASDHLVDHRTDQISDLYDEENTKSDGIIDSNDYEYTTTDYSNPYESTTFVSNGETTENYVYDESTYDYSHDSTSYEPFENFETSSIPQEIDFKFRSGGSKNKNSKKSNGKKQGVRDISMGTKEIQKVFVTDTVLGHWKDLTTKENTPDTSTLTETETPPELMITEINTPTEGIVTEIITETNIPTEKMVTEIMTETNTPTEDIVTEIMTETNTPTEDIVTEIMIETNTPTEDIVTEIMTETNTPTEDIVTEIITERNAETESIDTETNTPTEVITTLSNTETNTEVKNKLMILNRDLSNASFLENVNVMKGHHVTTMEPLSIITSAFIQGISGIKMALIIVTLLPFCSNSQLWISTTKNFLGAGRVHKITNCAPPSLRTRTTFSPDFYFN